MDVEAPRSIYHLIVITAIRTLFGIASFSHSTRRSLPLKEANLMGGVVYLPRFSIFLLFLPVFLSVPTSSHSPLLPSPIPSARPRLQLQPQLIRPIQQASVLLYIPAPPPPTNCSIVKDGWGSRSNFQYSFGLHMTPEGIEEENRILDAFRKDEMEEREEARRNAKRREGVHRVVKEERRGRRRRGSEPFDLRIAPRVARKIVLRE